MSEVILLSFFDIFVWDAHPQPAIERALHLMVGLTHLCRMLLKSYGDIGSLSGLGYASMVNESKPG